MSTITAEGIMFDNITPEQREAFKRRAHAVDAMLKSAIVEPHAEAKRTPLRRLHLIPSLQVPHFTHERNAQVA
jgi:hypothetical protein